MTRFRKLLASRRVQRYLVIGLSVYLLELLVILGAQRLGASSVMAVGLSYCVGLVVSFALQKIVTFGDSRLHYRVVLRQALLTGFLLVFNFGFTLLVTQLLSDLLPAVVCRTLALAMTTLWNFYLYKTHIFSQTSTAKKKLFSRRIAANLKSWRQRRKKIIRAYRHWHNMPATRRWRNLGERRRIGRLYLVLSLSVLFITMLLWAGLGAALQQGNADQLVNSYLFENATTFHGAAFPDQHSFLLKWPLFYLIKMLGFTSHAFIAVSVGAVMVTLAGFMYLLSRIERRPLALGAMCLLLSSALLLVPAQPYAGGLLPVNMAMLTTRNLEYLVYLLSLVWLIRAVRVRSWHYAGAVSLLGLLMASDKLFLPISVAGALSALVCYALAQRWQLVTLAVRWLLASVAAGALSVLLLAGINAAQWTNVVGTTVSGPYGAVHGLRELSLGLFYGIAGLFTNFGANPAYDALTIQDLPASAAHHLLSPAGPAYLLNALCVLAVGGLAGLLLYRSLRSNAAVPAKLPAPTLLANLLVWSSISATALFILTNHYYQVDARYLTLWLFTGFVVLAVWLRPRRLDAALPVLALPILLVVIIGASLGALQTYSTQRQAFTEVNRRNLLIAQSLQTHPAAVLVGDYWRVVPIKALSKDRQQTVLPLGQCNQPRQTLTSQSWQPDLHKRRVAYLLTLDSSLTDYRNCTLKQVIEAYGLPNDSRLIAGSLSSPQELLLFYDQGAHSTPSPADSSAASLLPVPLTDLPETICSVPTIMNIVAHQDDDLLFLSPDLLHDVAAGNCVRSIYLTAGDAGGSQQYWLAREHGSEAAYATMLDTPNITWTHLVVALPGGQFVTVANPVGNNHISLIFMHLPDGNLDGQGFHTSQSQSLAELEGGTIPLVRTVDRQSSYTSSQLTEALIAFMHAYQPAEIRTQSGFAGQQIIDHSDHMVTGRFVTQAHDQYQIRQYAGYVAVPLRFYIGYPVREFESNISSEDLALKQAVFMAYAHFDGGVCRRADEPCQESDVYQEYLSREYQYTN